MPLEITQDGVSIRPEIIGEPVLAQKLQEEARVLEVNPDLIPDRVESIKALFLAPNTSSN